MSSLAARVGNLAGERLEVAGRALMLLVLAIDQPST
jgi:hypothetical protein